MGKHDKHIEASSEEFYKVCIAKLKNDNKEAQKKLDFANETIARLQEQCSRMSKWASEIEANAKEIADAKDEYIKSLEETVVALAVGRTQGC